MSDNDTNLGPWKKNPFQDRKPGTMGTGDTPSPKWEQTPKTPKK